MNTREFMSKHIFTIIQMDSEYQEFMKKETEKFHKQMVEDCNRAVRKGELNV
jgi:hypothetical protein